MYLVVIGILGLVLTLADPVKRFVQQPALVWATVVGATLLPAIVGLLLARRVVHVLDQHPEQPSRGQAVFGRGMVVLQMLLALGHGAILMFTNWLPLCRATPVVGNWPLLPALMALVPFLLSMVLMWLTLYPADRAVRQIALEVYLLRGKPVRPVWRRLGYVIYNLRHQVLFVLIPMLLILAASDIVTRYAVELERVTRFRHAPDLLVGAAALGVAIIAPEILRHVWATQRLPDGPLRDRLQALADKLRLRFREILVWRSGGLLVNAAVMGVVPPLRYVLITDGMLEQMDDTKIEAVFGHEAGHVKRHHILFFLLFGAISGCIVTIASIQWQGLPGEEYELRWMRVVALLALKWVIIFGWISRRFERQADMFGVRTLALAGVPCSQPCALHTPPANPGHGPPAGALCSTAAHIFADALHEVAVLNGIRPEARSWRHSSISSRSRFLLDMAGSPRRVQRFERVVLAIKLAIFATAVVAALWAASDLRIWAGLARWLT